MNILVVDDIEDSRLLFKKILESSGHSVVTAINGRDALEKARSSFPDIILSDILMPKLDGFGLCREIQKDKKLRGTPIILCTSTYSDQKDEQLALDLGAARFVVRPIDSKALLGIIRDVMKENEQYVEQEPEQPSREDALSKVHESRLLNKLNEKHQALKIKHMTLLRKEAELQVSEEKYRSIFNSVNDAIFIHDIEDASILDVNQKMCDLFGYTSEEALKLKVEDLSAIDPAITREAAQIYIEKAIQEGPQDFQWECKDKGERSFWVDINLKLINLDGADRIIAVVRDISEKKRAEEALRESEHKLKVIFDNAIDGILVADVETRHFIAGNQAIINMLGYSMEELKTLSVPDIHPDNELTYVLEQFKKQANNKIVTAKDIPVKRKDGSIFYADINSSPVNLVGRSCLVGMFRDITQGKKSQEELLLVQASIDNTSESIFWIDKDGRFINVNNSACTNLGYTKEEMMLMNIFDIDPNFPEEKWFEQWRDLKRRGSISFETFHKLKNGKEQPVEVKLNYMEFGGKEYNFVFARDITERKKAEDILRGIAEDVSVEIGEAFFQTMVSFISRALDVKYAFIGVLSDENPNAIKTIAVYSDDKIIDNFEYDLAGTPSKNVMTESLCLYPQNVQQLFPEDLLLKEMGVESYIGALLVDSQKKNIGILVVMDSKPLENEALAQSMFQIFALRASSEIERTQSEEALRDSEARFRTIFENSPVGITIANSSGEIIDSNPAFQNMLGYTKDELSRKFSELTYPDDVTKNMHLFQEMLDGNSDHYMMEKRYYHKDGSIVWVNLIVTAIRDRNRAFKYNFAIIENITERKKLEDQLRHAQRMEAVGQLAGGVAHDFNNILTAIIGYGSLLKLKLKDNEHLMHNINQILAITERGAGLTQSLLAFSRKQNISLRPVNPNYLIERISKLIPRLIGEEIEFKIKLCDQEMTVMADSSQLEQVLMNLAGNARDAMNNRGVLTIETEYVTLDMDYVKMHGFGSKGPYALISVSDTGIGIDPETIDKIFEPFFTTKEVGEGTGLGLSLVYGIIKQHNGHISVYSEPGHGTTFKIHLPLIKETKTDRDLTEDDLMVGGAETILLAEDEAAVRGAIKEILQAYGFSVIEAIDGKDAIDKYNDNKDRINLLIMDVVMPKMNGKESYDEIRKITPGIKAIFTSGYTEKTVHSKGVLQEKVHFISKPVMPNNLLKKIREVMDES